MFAVNYQHFEMWCLSLFLSRLNIFAFYAKQLSLRKSKMKTTESVQNHNDLKFNLFYNNSAAKILNHNQLNLVWILCEAINIFLFDPTSIITFNNYSFYKYIFLYRTTFITIDSTYDIKLDISSNFTTQSRSMQHFKRSNCVVI